MKNKIVIDGKNAILGRLASYAAKQLLLGREVAIVNSEKILISGKPRSVIEEYKEMRRRGGSSQKGPFFPKHPDKLMKRTIKGMLPHKRGRGTEALKKVKCYNGVPEEFAEVKKIVSGKEKNIKTISLERLSEEI